MLLGSCWHAKCEFALCLDLGEGTLAFYRDTPMFYSNNATQMQSRFVWCGLWSQNVTIPQLESQTIPAAVPNTGWVSLSFNIDTDDDAKWASQKKWIKDPGTAMAYGFSSSVSLMIYH